VKDPARILVVDDSDAPRFVKVQTLRRAGFTVIEAATGTDALALVASERPDLAIMDVNLPDISGIEVCRRLRAAESSSQPGLQILQVSSTAVAPSDRVQGLEQGADVYLTEPVESEVLVATVHALLRVRRAEAAMAAALEGERRARRAAEQTSQLKDEFIATLSHELRTPLNALMGWIWQLRHTSLGEEARKRALDSLERNARMQAQLINDLLDVSRASKGKLQLELRLVDFKGVASAAVDFVHQAVEAKGLQLQLDLTSVWVAGDHARLQQMVTNLITNAIQFTPAGGRIAVTVGDEGDSALLTVQDTGSGIDEAFLPYVFDQFRQGEGGLSRMHGGLGLGLTVVKQLVDLHGGSVDVASPGIGLGTTFTVRLPRESDLPATRESSDLLLQDVKVSLVLDDESVASMLRAILESSGATVSLAQPASAGESQAADGVDLIVTDGSNGRLTFRAPGSIAAPWQAVVDAARPCDIVRQVARSLTPQKAS
jgi:signal transduction histidine kinase